MRTSVRTLALALVAALAAAGASVPAAAATADEARAWINSTGASKVMTFNERNVVKQFSVGSCIFTMSGADPWGNTIDEMVEVDGSYAEYDRQSGYIWIRSAPGHQTWETVSGNGKPRDEYRHYGVYFIMRDTPSSLTMVEMYNTVSQACGGPGRPTGG